MAIVGRKSSDWSQEYQWKNEADLIKEEWYRSRPDRSVSVDLDILKDIMLNNYESLASNPNSTLDEKIMKRDKQITRLRKIADEIKDLITKAKTLENEIKNLNDLSNGKIVVKPRYSGDETISIDMTKEKFAQLVQPIIDEKQAALDKVNDQLDQYDNMADIKDIVHDK